MLFLRRITEDHLLAEFKERYMSVSGLDVPDTFLKTRDVYAAFNLKNKMCGGFVLGTTAPFRTVEVFSSAANRQGIYDFIKSEDYCELNCFWLSINYRKGITAYWFWLLFAMKVSAQPSQMLICGTIAKSLADLYGYPRKSKLLHCEELMMNGKARTSYIFIFARADFFVGVLETFVYKLKNNGKKPVMYKEVSLPAPVN